MDPFTLSMILGAGVQVVSSIVGELMAQGKDQEAAQLRQAALQQYQHISPPDFDRMTQQHIQDTHLAQVKVDPSLVQAQRDALGGVRDISQTGFDATDRAALEAIRQRQNANERGQREAIVGSMRRRGRVGAGDELTAQLLASQAGADRASAEGMQEAARAEQRRYGALGDLARLAGGMRDQSFGEQAKVADARDMIERWNYDRDFDIAKYNNGLAQNEFGNTMRLADSRADAYGKAAGDVERAGDRTRDVVGGIGDSAAQAIQGWGMMQSPRARSAARAGQAATRGASSYF